MVGVHEPAVEGRLAVGGIPELTQEPDRLVELIEAIADRVERHAEIGVLAWHPPEPEPGDHPPAGDRVDGGDHLAQMGRVPHPGGSHQRPQLDTVGPSGQRGQQGPGLHDRNRRRLRAVEVIAHPQRVKPHRLELARRVDRFRPGPLDLRNRHPDMNASTHRALLSPVHGLYANAHPARKNRRMGQLDDDAAVHPTGDGTYTTRVSSAWNIGATPNGGYAMSSALRALVDVTGRPDPASVTVHYLRPATPDADGTITTRVVRSGPFGGLRHRDAGAGRNGAPHRGRCPRRPVRTGRHDARPVAHRRRARYPTARSVHRPR